MPCPTGKTAREIPVTGNISAISTDVSRLGTGTIAAATITLPRFLADLSPLSLVNHFFVRQVQINRVNY